jgi:hypothetical protein
MRPPLSMDGAVGSEEAAGGRERQQANPQHYFPSEQVLDSYIVMVVAWSSPGRGHSQLQEPHGKPEWPQLEAASTSTPRRQGAWGGVRHVLACCCCVLPACCWLLGLEAGGRPCTRPIRHIRHSTIIRHQCMMHACVPADPPHVGLEGHEQGKATLCGHFLSTSS